MSLALGIDVGGTKVLGGVVDSSGKIVKSARKQTPPQGGEALTNSIAELALELISEFDISAVGVSAAGFISSDRKTMLATPNIAGWNGINLTEQLEKQIGRRVVLENDANSAAWGEKKFGAGRDFQTVIMLTVGTGLGGGLIVDDQLYRGPMELVQSLVTPEQFPMDTSAAAAFEDALSNMPQEMRCCVMPAKQLLPRLIWLETY